jgi:hypothetical protein
MQSHHTDGFWEGGERAWWRGLKVAIDAAKQRLDKAQSDEERRTAEADVQKLDAEAVAAEKHGDEWLF